MAQVGHEEVVATEVAGVSDDVTRTVTTAKAIVGSSEVKVEITVGRGYVTVETPVGSDEVKAAATAELVSKVTVVAGLFPPPASI